jgi:hypothetical protein
LAQDDQPDAFERAWRSLTAWMDADAAEVRPLALHRLRARGESGQALVLLDRMIRDEPTKRAHREARIALLEALGWEHLAVGDRAWLAARFPTTRRRLRYQRTPHLPAQASRTKG